MRAEIGLRFAHYLGTVEPLEEGIGILRVEDESPTPWFSAGVGMPSVGPSLPSSRWSFTLTTRAEAEFAAATRPFAGSVM